MVQALQARVPAQAGVWVEARARVEAEWAGRSPQGRAEIVYAPTVATRSRTSPDNPAIKNPALNVVQERQDNKLLTYF